MKLKLRKLNLWILFLGFSVFVASGYFSDVGLVASIGKLSEMNLSPASEKTYSQPRTIRWRGEIISTMAGGSCIGVRGDFSGFTAFLACLPDVYGTALWNYSGTVTITGKWIGITCAYKNTVFGSCVPDVLIERISL